jgi:translation initiation factor eIF-2B subunit gamma
VTAAMKQNPFLTSLPKPQADILAPKDLDFNTGTAEILRMPEVKSVVKSDFIVLPCDLVCELGGDRLLQAWLVKSASIADMAHDADDDALDGSSPSAGGFNSGLGVWYEAKTETPIKGQETDFIATVALPPSPSERPTKESLIHSLSKLVYSMPKNSLKDIVDEREGFPLRHSLITQHPRVRLRTTHRDAHIYIFPHWVMDFVSQNDNLDSIGEDVLGWWAKATWQKGLDEKLGLRELMGGKSTDMKSSRDDFERPSTEGSTARSQPSIVPPMLAYVQTPEPSAPLIRRVDTAQLLLQTSLRLAKLPSIEEAGFESSSPFAHPRKVSYPEGLAPKTNISQVDTLLADNVTVAQKSTIKESCIGASCQIGEGAKILQCLLMDDVIVGKNCKLTRCVVGRRVKISDNCTLTDCEVQENLLVEPKSKSISPEIGFRSKGTFISVSSMLLIRSSLFSRSYDERREAHVSLRSGGHRRRDSRVDGSRRGSVARSREVSLGWGFSCPEPPDLHRFWLS